jgi:hypothetical protein
MREREREAMISLKGLPKGVIAKSQSRKRSAPALAIATFGGSATNAETACVRGEEATKKVVTLNLEAWFSTPNIIDLDEMLIGV